MAKCSSQNKENINIQGDKQYVKMRIVKCYVYSTKLYGAVKMRIVECDVYSTMQCDAETWTVNKQLESRI